MFISNSPKLFINTLLYIQNLKVGGQLHLCFFLDKLTVPSDRVHHHPFLLSLVVFPGQKGGVMLFFFRVTTGIKPEIQASPCLIWKKSAGLGMRNPWHAGRLSSKTGQSIPEVWIVAEVSESLHLTSYEEAGNETTTRTSRWLTSWLRKQEYWWHRAKHLLTGDSRVT